MSLYRYVDTKDQLLTLMVDGAWGPPPEPVEDDEPWRAGLERWAWDLLRALRQHPWALEIPISGPPNTPNAVAWMEAALRAQRDTGLHAGEKMSVLLMVSGYVRNDATLNRDITTAIEAVGGNLDDAMANYTRQLRLLTDPERFPHLRAVLDTGVLDRSDDPDEEFTFGLDRILDGVEALVRTRGGH